MFSKICAELAMLDRADRVVLCGVLFVGLCGLVLLVWG